MENILLEVPFEYRTIYSYLLNDMNKLGTDLIYECDSICKSKNKNILNCWNMFQTACCAYELKEFKKANLIIDYIKKTLNYENDNSLKDTSTIWYGIIDADINNEEDSPFMFGYKIIGYLDYLNGTDMGIHEFPNGTNIMNIKGYENNELILIQKNKYHVIVVKDSDTNFISSYIGKNKQILLNDNINNYIVDKLNSDHGDDYTIYVFYSPIGATNEEVHLMFKSIKNG